MNIHNFCLRSGGHRPVDSISFIDETGTNRTIPCYDEEGVSKGLKKIAFDLGYVLPSKIRLEELKNILIHHPAFSPIKKLTLLAEKYGLKIIYLPKFHCELNPIEGLW